ncbi:MAG TPA: TIGR03560 family F420-dependent LLM class oxidoreductase [Tepidiformaceae bacterium]|nr:TIGR03560 family F420-dependent LLM class oxidoreductase [Tepidiformaceae bacterium]
MKPPLRFGIQTPPQNVTFGEMRDCWQTAERAGFDIAYVFDHFIPIFSDENGPCMECFTTLTALACATERIRLSTLVVGAGYRHPAVLANICATLDVISGGRFELGIGAGWWEREYQAYGMEFPPIGRRIRMMEEAVRVVRMLCSEQAPTFHGRYYSLEDARLEPKPIQRPCFPIFIGGRGEQLTLRAVARVGNGWNIIGTNAEEFERKRSVLLEHCEREGRDPAELRMSAAMRFSGTRPLPPGTPAGGAISGSAAEMTEQVGRLIEAGADEVILSMRAPYDLEGLEQFGREVAAKLR